MQWLIMASATALAIDAAGMPPQIEELRGIATQHHLQQLCLGHEGELQVIRLGFPVRASAQEVADLKDQFRSIASQIHIVDNQDVLSGSCDHEPVVALPNHSPPLGDPRLEPATHDLTWGPIDRLRSFLPIAISCGFEQAEIRPINDVDRAFISRAHNAPKVGSDWMTLDAGERVDDRDGPLGCFAQLSFRTARRNGMVR